MKKNLMYLSVPLLFLFALSGCSIVEYKISGLSVIYAVTAVLAFLLLVGYIRFVRPKNTWFLLLFSSVSVVNTGYLCLSMSSDLNQALMANRLAYLGSVLLPLSMLMIILNVIGIHYGKRLPCILFSISVLTFFVAASPGILDIYYKDVSFVIENGVARLIKVYGPLHPLYLVYLLGYFVAMVAVVFRAASKRQIDSTAHSVILVISVFVNIGVWAIEQLVHIEFEMLSVSYIISELFLLGVHLMVNENKRLRALVKEAQTVQNLNISQTVDTAQISEPSEITAKPDTERYEIFLAGLEELTQTEKTIYEAYIARITTKEIMELLHIKENTLKFHNKNIYSKLGVSSRKELMEIYKQLKAMKFSE